MANIHSRSMEIRSFLTILLIFISFLGFSQGDQTIIWVKKSATDSQRAILHLPDDYNSTPSTKRYPTMIFFHGLGEVGSNPALIYNSTTAGGPAYVISQGHNMQFTNPITGVLEKYIVVSPQSSEPNSTTKFQTPFILKDLYAKYPKIDTNRVILTGLSQGAKAGVEYPGGLAGDPAHKMAGIIPMSAAISGSDIGPMANKLWADRVAIWGFGGKNSATPPVWDTHGANTGALVYNYNLNMNPDVGKMTEYVNEPSHGGWHRFYDPNYRETFTIQGATKTVNIYEWGLAQTALPVAAFTINVGADRSITLPTNSTTATMVVTTETGKTVSSYLWSPISGPSTPTFTASTSASTDITNLISGVYQIKGTATQSDAQSKSDTLQVTVITPGNTPPIADAGSNQTIFQPASQVTLAGSGSDPDGSVSSHTWSKISGPSTYTITNPSLYNTTVTGLVQGTYLFRLAVTDNSGSTTADTMQVSVNADPTLCTGVRRIVTRQSWGAYYKAQHGGGNYVVNAGDTLVIRVAENWANVGLELENFYGTPSCPIVIINEGGQVSMSAMKLKHCRYIKITGSGAVGQQYGFYFTTTGTKTAAVAVEGRSKNIEIERTHTYKQTYMAWVKSEAQDACPDSMRYPNWYIDSINYHHNKGVNIGQDGLYFGSTSPNGQRAVVCNGVTIYPIPLRLSNIKINNNIIDSCNRTAIQLSGADMGENEIAYNTVTRAGYELNQSQGAGIISGGTTTVYIHDNYVRQTFNSGITIWGAGLNRVENNDIDSSGYLGSVYNSPNQPSAILVNTYVTAPTQVNTTVLIKNNVVGRVATLDGKQIVVLSTQDTYNTNNVVCSNTKQTGGSADVYVAPDISYNSEACPQENPNVFPEANAGEDKVLNLPYTSTLLEGVGSDADGVVSTYVWTKISGSTYTIDNPNIAQPTISGLQLGVYVFRLTVTDNMGGTSTDDVIIRIAPFKIRKKFIFKY